MNVIKSGLASLLLFWGASAIAIPIVTLVPSVSSLEQGDPLRVDAIVTGLQDEFIGSFDLTIHWNDGAFSFLDLSFGGYLDGPLDSIQGFDAGTNRVNAFEVSLGFLERQSGTNAFQLFSFNLLALGGCLEALRFDASSPQILGDGLGLGFADSSLTGATVLINAPTTSVPEPATAALLLIGVVGLVATRRKPVSR